MSAALDPQSSVVVEACAGSGKTWMLVSRLLRLLLAGVSPGQILAITYTRKAAREIEARLREWLADLATKEDEWVVAFLVARGLDAHNAHANLLQVRKLYEQVLHADPPITLTTFHGWFGRLLAGAPLASGIVGTALEESVGELLDEAWADFAQDCATEPNSAAAQSLLWLYGEVGAFSTRLIVRRLVDRRAEWSAWLKEAGGLEQALTEIEQALAGVDPWHSIFHINTRHDLARYAGILARNGSRGASNAERILQGLAAETPEAAFDLIRQGLLTSTDEPRSLSLVKDMKAALGEEGGEDFLRLHAQLCEQAIDTLSVLDDRRNGLFNRHALVVGDALVNTFDALKRSRRVMDFADLETAVDRLLQEEGTAAFMQARLDARYRHILLDEFQDTNPLQWRILLGWLDAYVEAGITAPTVFMVGDPKQSIYRFRRADPRLFDAAKDYFATHFGAQQFVNAHTYRNAGVIVDVVNRVFSSPIGIPNFTLQTSQRAAWPGRVEVLPLIARSDRAVAENNHADFRDALNTPLVEPEDERRALEAKQLAERLSEIVGRWRVGVGDEQRPLRYGDVLVLTRRTTILAPFESALREAGIPFVSPGRGGLLESLEAQDLLAALRFLSNTADSLALAHLLRTPPFDVSDETLQLIAANARSGDWWSALERVASQSTGLARARDLLLGWQRAARVLPSHDLIDLMFHEAQWMARYRARVPQALWPGVHANLEALLELALSVDAGRYPSLTRFVDELRRLQTSDDDAPSEGLIRTAGDEGEEGGRVRIMTIHGAKGLEAPVVWLIDANAPGKGLEGYQALIDWPADARAPQQFSLLQTVKAGGKVRRHLIDGEREALARESLNLLYVAMTRAEQALFVSGIEPARKSSADTAYSRINGALLELGADDGVIGAMPEGEARPVSSARRMQWQRPELGLQIGERRAWIPQDLGLRFGTALHAWMEATLEGRPAPAFDKDVVMAGERILSHANLRRFFDPNTYIKAGNETAFLLPDGRTGRVDRWVDDGDAIWVLDYKSGQSNDELMENYRQQLTVYRDAMRAIFPHRVVRCLLVFTDGSQWELPVD